MGTGLLALQIAASSRQDAGPPQVWHTGTCTRPWAGQAFIHTGGVCFDIIGLAAFGRTPHTLLGLRHRMEGLPDCHQVYPPTSLHPIVSFAWDLPSNKTSSTQLCLCTTRRALQSALGMFSQKDSVSWHGGNSLRSISGKTARRTVSHALNTL